MKSVFEKIIEELEENQTIVFNLGGGKPKQSIDLLNAIEIVKQEAERRNNGWIPFTQRKLTEEEKKEIVTEYNYMLDCKLPEEDEEILVTCADGTVGEDIFMCDGTDCYLDSGNDFITEAIAWRHKPDPYRPNGE